VSVDEHPEWPEVPMSDFKEYLKTCPDYRGDCFGRLEFRHNGEVFAVLLKGGLGGESVRVSPKILA